MSANEKAVGATGIIRIDSLEITITPLEQYEEIALDREMRRAAEAAAGDHFTRNRPMLDALKEFPGDRIEVLRELARLSDRREPLGAVAMHDFRCSPAGLAIELFARGKRATPGLSKDGLAAIITSANSDQIAAALFELFKSEDDEKKSQ